ncbi:MAG: hypothetical protein M0D57_12185 [Sphingobacteriales bacterium JAD_PAG50586_3]|nr:MAG: hypothetical protein M0D57_12185 [Sphingobacteriales bacterium JAD_PAG50586_3]
MYYTCTLCLWQTIVADDEFDKHDGDYYRTSKDWETLRNAAKVALESMNVKLEEPYLGEGTTYIQ